MLSGDTKARRGMAEKIPVGRLGKPEEAVLSLVSNPYITAQTVSVDGGMESYTPSASVSADGWQRGARTRPVERRRA